MNKELVIYTDSSLYRKMGSWSVLFKADDQTMVISGICPGYIKTAVQGETYAIIKAVELAEKLYPNKSKLKIFTDCIGLCYTLRQGARAMRNPVNRMLQKSASQKLAQFSTYTVLHVKSHQYKSLEENEASFYNNIVDTHAKKIRHQTQINPLTQKKTWTEKVMDAFLPFTAAWGQTYAFRFLEMAYQPKATPQTSSVAA